MALSNRTANASRGGGSPFAVVDPCLGRFLQATETNRVVGVTLPFRLSSSTAARTSLGTQGLEGMMGGDRGRTATGYDVDQGRHETSINQGTRPRSGFNERDHGRETVAGRRVAGADRRGAGRGLGNWATRFAPCGSAQPPGSSQFLGGADQRGLS